MCYLFVFVCVGCLGGVGVSCLVCCILVPDVYFVVVLVVGWLFYCCCWWSCLC